MSPRHYNFRHFMHSQSAYFHAVMTLSIFKHHDVHSSSEYDRLNNFRFTEANNALNQRYPCWDGLIQIPPQQLATLLWRYGYPDLAAKAKADLIQLGLWKEP